MGCINPHAYSKKARFNSRKSSTDNYETPSWGSESLYNGLKQFLNIDLNSLNSICDPCCGRGSIITEIARLCPDVEYITGSDLRAVDKINSDYENLFIDNEPTDMFNREDYDFDCVPINPPFTFADEMLLHLIDNKIPLICLLQRTQYMEGKARYEAVYKDHKPSAIFHFVNRLSMEIEDNAKLVPCGMMTFSWLIWEADFKGDTRVFWIADEPNYENDRRSVSDGIEVRDLLEWDRAFMYYKLTCEGCGCTHIRSRKKGLKGEWGDVCTECCTVLPTRTKQNKSKFDGLHKIA